AGNRPRIDGQSWIEPLNKPARLVRIVALRDVLSDQWRHVSWIKIERDADQSAGRLFWLFFKPDNSAFSVEINHTVLFRLLEAPHVVNAQHRSVFLAAIFAKGAQAFAEQIVSRHHDEIEIGRASCRERMEILSQ